MATEDLEKWKYERGCLRRAFTRKHNELDEKLKSDVDIDDLETCLELLEPKVERMMQIDKLIFQALVEELSDEKTLDDETEQADLYRLKWVVIKRKVDKAVSRSTNVKELEDDMRSVTTVKSIKGQDSSDDESLIKPKRHFRLPKLELQRFDEDVRHWIGFWGQFQKIHLDTTLDNYDKFQYLLQATEKGTSARELIESFPPSADNYNKAIEQLKDRFARDNLLIEVYVRELLNLVLSQVRDGHELILITLYDKLTTQLRALETLGVTSDKYAAMLLPMVESALPEEILKAYERLKGGNEKDDSGNQLSLLLDFLRKEVESNQRISITRSSLDKYNGNESIDCQNFQTKVPTASCLVVGDAKSANKTCIWCDKTTHSSVECYKIAKLSANERKELITKKKGCAICLRFSHHARVCKSFIKCLVCFRRHNTVMCPELCKVSSNMAEKKTGGENNSNKSTEMTLSIKNPVILLQTILVKIVHNDKKIVVRALIDNGAMRSYVKQDVVELLNMKSSHEEELAHYVFGDTKRETRTHRQYEFIVESLDGTFKFKILALNEKIICGSIPCVQEAEVLKHLKHHSITLTDVGKNPSEIKLLIEVDFSGYIMTSTMVQIEESLIALKTKLGWTLQGPKPNTYCNEVNNLLSLNDLDITELWNLETLGITEPTKKDVLTHFKDNITINSERDDTKWLYHGKIIILT